MEIIDNVNNVGAEVIHFYDFFQQWHVRYKQYCVIFFGSHLHPIVNE